MTWNDTTPPAAPDIPPTPAITSTDRGVASIRRGMLTALLAGGLLIVGGAAAVNAADPSASPAPSASQNVDDGTTDDGSAGTTPDRVRGDRDCPEDAGGTTDDGTTDDGTTDDSGVDGSST